MRDTLSINFWHRDCWMGASASLLAPYLESHAASVVAATEANPFTFTLTYVRYAAWLSDANTLQLRCLNDGSVNQFAW